MYFMKNNEENILTYFYICWLTLMETNFLLIFISTFSSTSSPCHLLTRLQQLEGTILLWHQILQAYHQIILLYQRPKLPKYLQVLRDMTIIQKVCLIDHP